MKKKRKAWETERDREKAKQRWSNHTHIECFTKLWFNVTIIVMIQANLFNAHNLVLLAACQRKHLYNNKQTNALNFSGSIWFIQALDQKHEHEHEQYTQQALTMAWTSV